MVKITGKVHCGGEGLEGAAVANGEKVVRTGADGGYALEAEPGAHTFVQVCVPDGYRALEGFFQPIPQGGGQIDFALEPAPERRASCFRVAHITDLHVVVEAGRLTGWETLVEDLRRLVDEARPDFIVASGDLTNRGTVAELEDLRRAFAAGEVPIFPLFGGHDGNEERFAGEQGQSFTRNFEQVIGPTHFSFDWGGRHFVFYPLEEGFFSLADRERKRQWLRADLEGQPAGRESVVVTHTPPPVGFMEEVGPQGVSAVLYGHWHSSKIFAHQGVCAVSAPPLCFGGIDTRPRGYRLVDFAEGSRQFALRALGEREPQTESSERITLGERTFALAWEQRLPGGTHRAAPVRGHDSVLASLADEGWPGEVGVRCLNGASGEMRWQAATDAAVKNSSVPVGTDAWAAVSVTGRLHLIDAASGQVRWQADLPGYPERWLFTSAAVDGEKVFAGGKAGYGAYELGTGRLCWYTTLESSDNWSCYASPLVCGERLVALVQRRGLLALDANSGEIAWERELAVEYQYGSPVLAGERVISGGDGGSLIALEAATGETVWQEPVLEGGYPSGLTVSGERIFAVTPAGEVRCCDLRSGALRWCAPTGPDRLDMTPYRRGTGSLLAAPAVRDGLVLVGGNDGMLHVLEEETGRCLQQVNFGTPLSAPPVLGEDELFVGTYDGRLCCYRAAAER